MNGKLNPFEKTTLAIPDKEEFIKSWIDAGHDEESVRASYEYMLTQEVWINDEYQVNIDRDPEHGLRGFTIMHLSIKRLSRDVIHDWRDLQQIKNMLAGPEYEAIEMYPAESRKVDSANQYHLWVLMNDGIKERPMFPVGWTKSLVTDVSINNSRNRKL
jgi:hypothetical protein